jgi:hypothetical protein
LPDSAGPVEAAFAALPSPSLRSPHVLIITICIFQGQEKSLDPQFREAVCAFRTPARRVRCLLTLIVDYRKKERKMHDCKTLMSLSDSRFKG